LAVGEAVTPGITDICPAGICAGGGAGEDEFLGGLRTTDGRFILMFRYDMSQKRWEMVDADGEVVEDSWSYQPAGREANLRAGPGGEVVSALKEGQIAAGMPKIPRQLAKIAKDGSSFPDYEWMAVLNPGVEEVVLGQFSSDRPGGPLKTGVAARQPLILYAAREVVKSRDRPWGPYLEKNDQGRYQLSWLKAPEPVKRAAIDEFPFLLSAEQDAVFAAWAASVEVDPELEKIGFMRTVLPILCAFAKAPSHPLDPAVAAAVEKAVWEIITDKERSGGSPPWATDYQTEEYELGFLRVKRINEGKRTEAYPTDIDAIIAILPDYIFHPDFYNTLSSSAAQDLIRCLEQACGVVKEGGFSKLFSHIRRVLGFKEPDDVYQYLAGHKGTMGIGEAITLPLTIRFWYWIKQNIGRIYSDLDVQKQVVQYANARIAARANRIKEKYVDFNPGYSRLNIPHSSFA
jgi:hypothetical protein